MASLLLSPGYPGRECSSGIRLEPQQADSAISRVIINDRETVLVSIIRQNRELDQVAVHHFKYLVCSFIGRWKRP